jgi:hypothetical protein
VDSIGCEAESLTQHHATIKWDGGTSGHEVPVGGRWIFQQKNQQLTEIGKSEMTGTMRWTRPRMKRSQRGGGGGVAASPARTMDQRGAGDRSDKEEVYKFKEDKFKEEMEDGTVIDCWSKWGLEMINDSTTT